MGHAQMSLGCCAWHDSQCRMDPAAVDHAFVVVFQNDASVKNMLTHQLFGSCAVAHFHGFDDSVVVAV